ncbi:hypothetical protein SESBI_00338 [Sesbania bispinosa]|nr:hypothetical protein SESBI_00338 [Sesbania bispinosa]
MKNAPPWMKSTPNQATTRSEITSRPLCRPLLLSPLYTPMPRRDTAAGLLVSDHLRKKINSVYNRPHSPPTFLLYLSALQRRNVIAVGPTYFSNFLAISSCNQTGEVPHFSLTSLFSVALLCNQTKHKRAGFILSNMAKVV